MRPITFLYSDLLYPELPANASDDLRHHKFSGQPFSYILVVYLCFGLLGFSGRDSVSNPCSTRGMTWVLIA